MSNAVKKQPQVRQFWRTPKGTELPLRDLRGKEYLEVQHRLIWFREERPDWRIRTELKHLSATNAVARAEILNEKGEIMSSAHKHEDKAGFNDFMEKAETGAIGRALALVGFGTQFTADELSEGERVVDSPTPPVAAGAVRGIVDKITQIAVGAKPTAAPAVVSQGSAPMESLENDPGSYIPKFGKFSRSKKNGEGPVRLRDIDVAELSGYVEWLKSTGDMRPEAAELVHFAELLFEQRADRFDPANMPDPPWDIPPEYGR